MPSRVEFDMRFGRERRRRDEDEPMRLLVLGDFSGNQPTSAAAGEPVDAEWTDNFDQVLRLRLQVTVPAGPIQFEQLDDFPS